MVCRGQFRRPQLELAVQRGVALVTRWTTAPPSLRVTLWMLLADLPPTAPLLLLATADVPLSELDPDAAGQPRVPWI
jgi:hypothetical protein